MNHDESRINMTDELQQITVRQKGDCDFTGDHLTNQPHTHGYEVCYVLEGSGAQIHAGQTIRVAKDDVFMAEPGVEHTVNAFDSGYLRVFYFVFDLNPTEQPGIISRFLDQHELHAPSQAHLRPLVEQVGNYLAMGPSRKYWAESTSQILLLDALDALTPRHASDMPSPHPAIGKAMTFCLDHLSKKITLRQIAKAAGTSPRNLQLLFRQHLGITVIEALNSERCKLASHYLDMGFRVSEVGPIIGIDDPAQFSRFFKRYTGLSPKAYKTGEC